MALIPLSAETHAKTRLRPLTSHGFAAGAPLVQICASEIVTFCHELPAVFVPEGEEFCLVLLTGLASQRNLLIDESGRWHGSHLPSLWRRGPFRLAPVAGEENRLALCVEDSSAQISESEGQPLFDETGAPTALLKEASTFLGKVENDLRQTREICRTLKAMGLLAPWPLEVAQPDGSKSQLQGLFKVEEPKIGELTGDQLVTLRNIGGLAVIYAHLLSLSKVSLLARLAQQLAARDQQRQAVRSDKVDLDRAFGIIEDDPFIF